MKVKSLSKSELAGLYNIHPDTLRKWLESVPDLQLKKSQRILTPKQVEKVFIHLGEPES